MADIIELGPGEYKIEDVEWGLVPQRSLARRGQVTLRPVPLGPYSSAEEDFPAEEWGLSEEEETPKRKKTLKERLAEARAGVGAVIAERRAALRTAGKEISAAEEEALYSRAEQEARQADLREKRGEKRAATQAEKEAAYLASIGAEEKRLRLQEQLVRQEKRRKALRPSPVFLPEAKAKIKKFKKVARTPEEMKQKVFAAPPPPTSDVELYYEEEFLDFEPFGPPTDVGADVSGSGIMSDPFIGSSSADLFAAPTDFTQALLGVGAFGGEGRKQIVEGIPVGVKVPGGLEVTHQIKDMSGALGYRLLWQGETIDWFPPKESSRREEVGIGV